MKCYNKGQPVLVGTTSIEKSEELSSLLRKKNVPHEVLNAKNHEREAEIVANAGNTKTVTIATNMAGRGTDIKLGENVTDVGGLYVLGTERHESRRIDNQLIGRSGRQGDPGQSRFFLSLEDDLVRLFGGEKMERIMAVIKIKKGEPIEHPLLTKVISSAQKKIEGLHFSVRKNLYELDSVMDQQRSAIYAHRDWLLKGEDIDSRVKEIVEDVVDRKLSGLDTVPTGDELTTILGFLPRAITERIENSKSSEELRGKLIEELDNIYIEKKGMFDEEFPTVMKYLMLRIIDERWRKHLEAIENLKDSVGLRAYGQKDPVLEFKKESFRMFEETTDSIYDDVVNVLIRLVRVDSDKARQKADKEFKSLNAVHSEFRTVGGEDKGSKASKKAQPYSKRFKVKK